MGSLLRVFFKFILPPSPPPASPSTQIRCFKPKQMLCPHWHRGPTLGTSVDSPELWIWSWLLKILIWECPETVEMVWQPEFISWLFFSLFSFPSHFFRLPSQEQAKGNWLAALLSVKSPRPDQEGKVFRTRYTPCLYGSWMNGICFRVHEHLFGIKQCLGGKHKLVEEGHSPASSPISETP